jgi:hypothetical protein
VAGITVEIEGIEKISDIKKKKLGRETDFFVNFAPDFLHA